MTTGTHDFITKQPAAHRSVFEGKDLMVEPLVPTFAKWTNNEKWVAEGKYILFFLKSSILFENRQRGRTDVRVFSLFIYKVKPFINDYR